MVDLHSSVGSKSRMTWMSQRSSIGVLKWHFAKLLKFLYKVTEREYFVEFYTHIHIVQTFCFVNMKDNYVKLKAISFEMPDMCVRDVHCPSYKQIQSAFAMFLEPSARK